MANQLITGQHMAQALCMETVNAFRNKGIQTVPHDRWNIELRGDEKDLCLLWYDMPPMSTQDRVLTIDRFSDQLIAPSAANIADMIYERTAMPIELLTLPLSTSMEIAERCSDPQSGVTVHLFQAYSALTNTMPWWVRLAYRIHTLKAGPTINCVYDAMMILGVIGFNQEISQADYAFARSGWQPGMSARELAGMMAHAYGVKSPLSVHEQYKLGRFRDPVDFSFWMDQTPPQGAWPVGKP